MSILGTLKTISVVKDVISLGSEIVSWFTDEEESPKKVRRITHPAKTVDRTKLTDEQVNRILTLFAETEESNKKQPDSYRTQADLAKQLNQEFGLNKSTKTYSRIWNTHRK